MRAVKCITIRITIRDFYISLQFRFENTKSRRIIPLLSRQIKYFKIFDEFDIRPLLSSRSNQFSNFSSKVATTFENFAKYYIAFLIVSINITIVIHELTISWAMQYARSSATSFTFDLNETTALHVWSKWSTTDSCLYFLAQISYHQSHSLLRDKESRIS